MAKIKNVNISFPASTSPDVVGYKLYISQAPDAVTYDSESFDLGSNTSVDLSSLPDMLNKDGSFNIGVTAVDDTGNESDMSVANDVALDFVAPDAPGEIVVTRS